MKVAAIPKEDLKAIFYIFSRRIGIFIGFVFILFFDSIYFAEQFTNG